MTGERKAALTAGILFILGTVAPIVGMTITGSLLTDPEVLIGISTQGSRIITGAFLQVVMGFACAGIACALYPVLRKYNEGLAIGSVGFRLIEGILACIAAGLVIVLVPLSIELSATGVREQSQYQILATILLTLRDTLSLLSLFAWCLSALMYYSVFFQTCLIPRWLSVWGLIGIGLTLIANFLVLFGFIANFSAPQVFMNLPIALQEMVFAVWLIVKGFNQKIQDSGN